MSGRRKIRDNVGMNLFPFMAVLICTTGALIMLLVVMVQQARVRATVDVAMQPVTPDPAVAMLVRANAQTKAENDRIQRENEKVRAQNELTKSENERIATENEIRLAQHEEDKRLAEQRAQEIEDLKWETSILTPSWQKTVEQLADQRLALSHIEAHTRELSEKASQMQAEADMIAAAARDELLVRENSQQDLEQLKNEIAAKKDEAEAIKKEAANSQKKYALIPYDGPSGTHRPPIYVECLPDRVVLQPENVVLIGDDFRPPLELDNPLASALRAKREFLLENGLIDGQSEPYPLLVVRPGSASSYAAARSAMTAWESEFGYELVEADLELDYKPANRQLKELLEDVVIESRGKRERMRLAMRSRRPSQPELLRPSINGGFETVRGRNGSGSGFGNGRGFGDDSGFGGGQGPGGGSGNGFGNGFGADNGGFGNAGRGDSLAGSQANGGRGMTSGGRYSSGSAYGPNGAPNDGRFNGSGSEATNRFGGPGGDFNNARGGSSNVAQSGNRFEGANSQFGGSPGGSQFANSGSYAGGSGGAGQNGSGNSGATQDGEGSNGSQQAYQGQSGPGQSMAGALAGQQTRGAGAGGNSSTATGSGGKGASGSGGSSGSQGQAASSGMAASATNFNSNQSLANGRGRNWALPPSQPDAVGIKRPIKVMCSGETLLLVPERGTRQEVQIFRHNGAVTGVVDPFVEAVRSRMETWGIAGRGIYWRPVLQVQIRDNADANYNQLLKLLENSGIEVTREP